MSDVTLTYCFYDVSGSIPGIAGEFCAGSRVTIDVLTNTVLSVESMAIIPEQPLQQSQEQPLED